MRFIRIAQQVGLAGVGAALLLLLGLAPAAAGAVKADFGDAPDKAPAGYSSAPGVTGHFPSKTATPGPRHSPFGSFFLGAGVNGEADSAQVNKDRFDDGTSVSLTKCGSSTLSVVLNGGALPAATLTSAHVAYINAWFDWNRDGDWADSTDGCSPEWAIQNFPVSMDKLSPAGVAVLPIGFTAGKHTRDIWERVTLTLDQPVSSPDGGGSASPYNEGETEDYLIPAGVPKPIISTKKKKIELEWRREEREEQEEQEEEKKRKKRGKFKVSCAPNPAVIPHGGVATVKFVIVDSGKGWIFGSPFTQKGPGGKASVTPVKPQPKGVPPGFVAADGFKQSGSKVDPPLRVQTVVVKFTFRRGNQTQKLDCKVLIVHWDGNLFLPRVVCEGTCRGDPPKNPTAPVTPLHGGGTLQSPLPPQSFFDVFFDLDVDAFKVVLPAGNHVVNPQAAPGAPYSCEPVTKTTENDTLLCTGNLPANTHAQGSFESSGAIDPGTAQLYGRQPGSTTFEGPFTLSGP